MITAINKLNQALNFEQAGKLSLASEEVLKATDELKDETDVRFILQELVQASPGAQLAMIQALDEFKEKTLEAFNKLKI